MAYDLMCANCSGPVMEGRCPTCRAAREQLISQQLPLWLILGALMLAAVVSLALALRPA